MYGVGKFPKLDRRNLFSRFAYREGYYRFYTRFIHARDTTTEVISSRVSQTDIEEALCPPSPPSVLLPPVVRENPFLPPRCLLQPVLLQPWLEINSDATANETARGQIKDAFSTVNDTHLLLLLSTSSSSSSSPSFSFSFTRFPVQRVVLLVFLVCWLYILARCTIFVRRSCCHSFKIVLKVFEITLLIN